MSQRTQVLPSGNLFSMIIETKLSNTELKKITIPPPPTAAAATTTTQPATELQVNSEFKELTWSELQTTNINNQKARAERIRKWEENKLNVRKMQQSTTAAIAFDMNQYSTQATKYTIENANAAYQAITNSPVTQPFNFTSSTNEFTFYSSTPTPDNYVEVTYLFEGKPLRIKLLNKTNVSAWTSPPDIQNNWNKITSVLFANPDNIINFRRIVKLMAVILLREVGGMGKGGRYAGNNALIQLEYSAVCWAIINMTKKGHFSSGGSILKLFDSNYTLNLRDDDDKDLDQDDPKKLIKTLKPNETEASMIAREDQNIKTRGFTNRDYNLELYVMAFFNGLINEEFEGGSNWRHVQGKGANYKIKGGTAIPALADFNGVTFPRYVNDGETGPSNFKDKTSNGKVFTMIDTIGGNSPNVLISIN